MTRCIRQVGRALRLVTLVVPMLIGLGNDLVAQEAQWIWSPKHDRDAVPRGTCHFRKAIRLDSPNRGLITIVADDEYEVFLNGRRVGQGGGIDRMEEYDVSRYLNRGRNIVAIRVMNTEGGTGAVAARVVIREQGEDWYAYSTDESWKTSLRVLPLWNTAIYNDSRWEDAQVFGELGRTPPWDTIDETTEAIEESGDAEMREAPDSPHDPSPGVASAAPDSRSGRFKISSEFAVEELLTGEQTGSLLSVTLNEFGHILAGKSEGPAAAALR